MRRCRVRQLYACCIKNSAADRRKRDILNDIAGLLLRQRRAFDKLQNGKSDDDNAKNDKSAEKEQVNSEIQIALFLGFLLFRMVRCIVTHRLPPPLCPNNISNIQNNIKYFSTSKGCSASFAKVRPYLSGKRLDLMHICRYYVRIIAGMQFLAKPKGCNVQGFINKKSDCISLPVNASISKNKRADRKWLSDLPHLTKLNVLYYPLLPLLFPLRSPRSDSGAVFSVRRLTRRPHHKHRKFCALPARRWMRRIRLPE